MLDTVLMVDLDGVVLEKATPWTEDLQKDLGLCPADLQQSFFRPHWTEIVCGRLPIRGVLADVLDQLGSSLPVSALLDYWFDKSGAANHRVLQGILSLREQGFAVHCATNQEPERINYLWHKHRMDNYFNRVHYSAELGYRKPDRQFFEAVAGRFNGDDPIFCLIDDTPENVRGAIESGWVGIHWTGSSDIVDLAWPLAALRRESNND